MFDGGIYLRGMYLRNIFGVNTIERNIFEGCCIWNIFEGDCIWNIYEGDCIWNLRGLYLEYI